MADTGYAWQQPLSVHHGLHDRPQPCCVIHVRIQTVHVHGHVHEDGHRRPHESPVTSVSLSRHSSQLSFIRCCTPTRKRRPAGCMHTLYSPSLAALCTAWRFACRCSMHLTLAAEPWRLGCPPADEHMSGKSVKYCLWKGLLHAMGSQAEGDKCPHLGPAFFWLLAAACDGRASVGQMHPCCCCLPDHYVPHGPRTEHSGSAMCEWTCGQCYWLANRLA